MVSGEGTLGEYDLKSMFTNGGTYTITADWTSYNPAFNDGSLGNWITIDQKTYLELTKKASKWDSLMKLLEVKQGE